MSKRREGAITTRLEWSANINVMEGMGNYRKTSIVCTIGKNNSVDFLVSLVDAGMNIVRLNFSHGDHEFHGQTVSNVKKVRELRPKALIAIALDTKGPEIRTGLVANDGSYTVEKGNEIILTIDEKFRNDCNEKQIFIDYFGLTQMQVGSLVYIEDGNLSLKISGRVDDKNLKAVALNTHTLTSRKNVNLPGTNVELPALSKKDVEDIKFGLTQDIDMIFASFIRRSADVLEIKDLLSDKGKHIKIISKIENQQGIKNFDDILAVTDGVMVARGDLGMEIPLEKVFVAQKMMISKCNIVGKPVICATQMLESMTNSPRPTRAECSDVANAVLDGADCVMLSGETAKGKFPVESVKMMHQICVEAERSIAHIPLFRAIQSLAVHPMQIDTTETIASSAVNATFEKFTIKAILALTTTGSTARYVAKYRPYVPIITVTADATVARQCHLYRGCYTLIYQPDNFVSADWQEKVEKRIKYGIKQGLARKLIALGDEILLIHGWAGGPGHTNTIRVVKVE